MNRARTPLLVSCLMALPTTGAIAADQTQRLLRYVPESANAVAIIRVEEILGGRRARREQWADKQKEKFLAGANVIPPWATTSVFGSKIQLEVPEEVWSVLLLSMQDDVKMANVARHENSQVETLADTPVVQSARDAYFVGLESRVLGIRSPGFRRDVAQWIRSSSRTRESSISPYLEQAASSSAHVVFALDLQDAVDPKRVLERLQSMPNLGADETELKALVQLARSLQGVQLEIKIGNQTDGVLTVDFGTDLGEEGKYVKSIVMNVLGDHGLALDDLKESRSRIEDRAVVLKTQFSDTSLRRILSLVVAPHPTVVEQPRIAQTPPLPAAGKNQSRAEASRAKDSKNYYRTIGRYLKDVETSGWDSGLSGTAEWFDRCAKKIEKLSGTNVDPELMKYGADVSAKLRALSASLRGVDVEVRTQQNTLTYDVHYDPGYSDLSFWGGISRRAPSYNVTSNLQEVRERQAEAVSSGTQKREQIWQMITQDRSRVRQLMQQKYNEDFGE